MQEYLKIFLIALVTSVAVLFALGPVMMKLQQAPGPRQQAEPASTSKGAAPVDPAVNELTAPNVVNMHLRDARERWRAQGFVIIEESQRVDSTVESGTILSQIPDGGAALQTKELRVVVAAAPELVTVPSVIGKTVTEATEALVEAGFEVPTPTKQASSEPLGEVLSQEPNAGSKSEKGSIINLTVSGEPEAAATGGEALPTSDEGLVEVPKVLLMSLSSAKTKLIDAGLTVGKVREREHEELGGRRVLSQNPEAGSKVAKGSAVDLVIVTPD
ncbi:PASTA domain-containing protein [Nannocystaceae bacterium ST9]